MNNLLAIIRKEFRTYFDSPIAYVFLVIYLVVTMFFFFFISDFFRGGGMADMRGLFHWMPWIFLFFTPALTMRLWAEERKTGTIELLFSYPIRLHEAVLGKFLAAFGLLAISVFLSVPLVIMVLCLGQPGRGLDLGPVIGAYIGSLLLGATFISLGCFVSSLTQNQIIAFIIAVTCNFFLIIVGTNIVLELLPYGIGSVAEYLGIINHFDSISRGVLDSRDIVYFLSLTFFFLFLNMSSLEAKR